MDVLWGVNFKRFIRRKNEEDFWRAYHRTFGITKVSEAGDLRGIRDIGSGRLFIVKPYGLARYDKQTGQDPKFPLTGGVDINADSAQPIPNLTGNTDFADTDVDLEPFNITPFKVFIPEKRQFFLENAGVFNFALGDGDQLFFSRQIGIDPVTGNQVPINGGAKLTGRVGRLELGVLDVDTRSTGPNPFSNFAVVRLKESLWAGSYVGVMGIDKRSGDTVDSFNQTGGVDTRLVFFKDWFVSIPTWRNELAGKPEQRHSDLGRHSPTGRTGWEIVERRKIGPNFNPQVGFVERPDSDEVYGDLTFKIRPRIEGVRELQFEGFLLHAPDTLGQVSTQEWQSTFRARVQQWRLHRRRYRRCLYAAHYDALPYLQECVHPERTLSFHAPPAHLRLGARSEIHLQLFRTLRRLLRRNAERVSRTDKLSADRKVLDLGFGDLGSVPFASHERKFLGCLGQLAGQLLFQSFSDFYEPGPDGHVERASRQRQSSLALQLPARQRSLHYL
jgi:hypothetical protein